MRYLNKSITKVLSIFFILTFMVACEDAPPTDYIEDTYIEALLIVNEPIQGIKVFSTQPLGQPYIEESSLIKNAIVKITAEDEEPIVLSYSSEEPIGYFNENNDYFVEEKTKYYLEVTLPNGNIITGETTTPKSFNWIEEPKDTIYFPEDTLNYEDYEKFSVSWDQDDANENFLVSIKCLDTLNYGSYLLPPDLEDKNMRVPPYKEEYSNEMADYYYTNINNVDVDIKLFKWFGIYEVFVYTIDYNYLRWYFQFTGSAYHDSQYDSVEGAVGVFGSASVIRKNVFLKKPMILYQD
jgi:hypothetical protein